MMNFLENKNEESSEKQFEDKHKDTDRIDYSALQESYRKLEINFPCTEAELERAYKNKLQEIRAYKFKNEQKILTDMEQCFRYIGKYINIDPFHPVFQEQDKNAENDWIDADELFNFKEADEPEEESIKTEEDLLPWESMGVKINIHPKKVKGHVLQIILWVILPIMALLSVLFALFGSFKERGAMIDSLTSQNALTGQLEKQIITLSHNQKVYMQKENITRCEISSYKIATGLRMALIQMNCTITQEDAVIELRITGVFRASKEGNSYKWSKWFITSNVQKYSYDYSGVWKGDFKLNEETNAVTSAQITLEETNIPYTYTGTCIMETANGKKGIYKVKAESKDINTELFIYGTDWTEKPMFFVMSDFIGYYDMAENALLPLPNKEDNTIFKFQKQ